ncbi:TetR family transcriptional regulator, partial [Streptomyces violaceoruber]
FERYRLDWKLGVPPDAETPGGTTCDPDLSRFFATGVPDRQDRTDRSPQSK